MSLTGEVYWCNACLEDAMIKAKAQTEELTPRKSQNVKDGHQVPERALTSDNNEAHRLSKMSPLKADHDIVPIVNGSLQSSAPYSKSGALLADDHLGSPTSDVSDVSYSESAVVCSSVWCTLKLCNACLLHVHVREYEAVPVV